MSEVAIFWFRHGLRIHDNPALHDALKDAKELYPVFIFDGEVSGTSTAGYNRWRFLHESLTDLDNSFKEREGRLLIFHGDPTSVLGDLINEWGVTKVCFEQDPEPVWHERDNKVKKMCNEKGVKCIERVSHTLWDPREVIRTNGGNPPLTFSQFCALTEVIGQPPQALPVPDFKQVRLPVPGDYEKSYRLKSLAEMGIFPEFPEQSDRFNSWMGGETTAMTLFKARMEKEGQAFRHGMVMPNHFCPDLLGSPDSLSPHLRFGCISVRLFYQSLREKFIRISGQVPSAKVFAQLIWREYFYIMSVNNPKYAQMEDNPICLQIDNWYTEKTKKEELEAWKKGKTGFPWIDACMRQLLYEGWIHHVGRHAVSTFLTRSDLWIHWEEGLKVFFKYLLDADWSVCAGNWMWVSSSAFEKCLDCPKCFHPVRYGQRMDPTGAYIRRYVPELKKMPIRYLFHPWKAPLEVQKQFGCVIGEDYPAPIVDHAKASRECCSKMERIKNVYLKEDSTPHVRPSDSSEVRDFVWLPANLYPVQCTANDLCTVVDQVL